MTRKAILLAALALGLGAAGCNTVRGAGQDLQSASNAVDNAMH